MTKHAKMYLHIMEFLDPELKRARAIRLFVGYVLVAILIGLSTLIIVYLIEGYSYNPNKETITQSGLVFINSQPVSANIYINNKLMGQTNTKFSLSEGRYQITLKAAKYRDWSRTFNLAGGTVLYLSYPRLFPINITLGVTYNFKTAPVWASQSPDRHWLVVQPVANSPVFTIFALQNPNTEPTTVAIPSQQLISQNGQYGELTPVGWADDNDHLLLEQRLPNGQITYIVFNKNNPDQSFNLSSQINMANDPIVSLKNNKYNSYYVFYASSGELFTADLDTGQAATPILTGIVAYKTFANNLITYVTYANAPANQAKAIILNNQTDSYLLQNLPRDPNNKYLINMAQYNGDWYYVLAAASGNKLYIYKNPLANNSPGNTQAITPQMSLGLTNPQYVTFSANARFIAMQSGKQFVVYDADQNSIFHYTSPLNIAPLQQALWMDGQRLDVVTNGKIQVFDFDGTNQQTLTTALTGTEAYFDPSYSYVYSFIPQFNGQIGFEYGHLIAN